MPGEIHTYLDTDGQPCSTADAWTTVVEREPEWLESDWRGLEALLEYRSKVCPGCGIHESQLTPEHRFTFEDKHCNACKASAQWGRALAAHDEIEAERLQSASPLTARDADGRHTYIKFLPQRQ